MDDMQERVEQAIRETLADPEGAGSDLTKAEPFGGWIEVEGNLDVQHLASHIIAVVEEYHS